MTSDAPQQVCAVVVTYNRKDLLRECIQALLAQTHSVSLIWVFNNISTDGTLEMLTEEFPAERFPQVRVTTLPDNIGGAGGFHEGIKNAAQAGFEWLWLMDDDTIAEPNALAELFAARNRFEEGDQPDLLGSKVVWTDGTLHPMNMNWVDQRDLEKNFRAAAAQAVPIRSATFVSFLVNRRFVHEFGLPIRDYFIWADDVEYSGRILRENFGVAVPASVVVHKTPRKHASSDPSPRFYYHVRNGIWMLTRSKAFSSRERTKMWIGFAATTFRYVKRAGLNWQNLRPVILGARDGFFRRPGQ
jgi:GT2 family glycosyltransferase